MLRDFNLIVSTYRNRENDCISELWFFSREVGDTRIKISKTGLPGLLVAKTSLNPLTFVERLRAIAEKSPWDFRYILKVLPIEAVVPSTIEEISKVALEFSKRLPDQATYKIEVKIRLANLSKRDIIESIAPKIPNKVNLTNPDKIILIEVIGESTGISLLEPKDILSIQKIKMRSSS